MKPVIEYEVHIPHSNGIAWLAGKYATKKAAIAAAEAEPCAAYIVETRREVIHRNKQWGAKDWAQA